MIDGQFGSPCRTFGVLPRRFTAQQRVEKPPAQLDGEPHLRPRPPTAARDLAVRLSACRASAALVPSRRGAVRRPPATFPTCCCVADRAELLKRPRRLGEQPASDPPTHHERRHAAHVRRSAYRGDPIGLAHRTNVSGVQRSAAVRLRSSSPVGSSLPRCTSLPAGRASRVWSNADTQQHGLKIGTSGS